MTLEFERLTTEINEMVRSTYQRQQEQQELVQWALDKLETHAVDWERVERTVRLAREQLDMKFLRTARPLDHDEPLNSAVDPALAPAEATIIATDGSQILPDRHGAFLYSLINIGIIVYFHGRGRAPVQFTEPALDYPGRSDEEFVDNGAIVNLRRDQAEIEMLARTVWQYAGEARERPLLALLDQRLLYWPAVGANDAVGSRVLHAWQRSISEVRHNGGWLAGYIVNPGKRSVLTMLQGLDYEEAGFDPNSLIRPGQFPGLSDARLFSQLLRPGQRSKVFVDVSQHNDDFANRDPENEICFFYLNPARRGRQIARVDLPISVARDRQVVDAVHALVEDQCGILGDYPYVLTRADEVAVVGRRDQEELNGLIANAMERYGLGGDITAKQSTKNIARAAKTRHEI
jgi:hypothetical protein